MEIKSMNKAEREAFIKAYLNNAGYAPREYVEDILTKLDADAHIEYDEYYTNVADALGVWCEALEFANKQKENK